MFKSWFTKKKTEKEPQRAPKAGPSPATLSQSKAQEDATKKKKVFQLSETEKNHFVQLYYFLLGSHWRVPIESFMDEYCIIFDDEEENKLEYTTYHKVPFKPANIPFTLSISNVETAIQKTH